MSGKAKKSRILLKCKKFCCFLFPGGGGADVITYLAGHESLAGAGWAEKRYSLDVLTAQLLINVQGIILSAVLTYLAGHKSLAGAGWAEKLNSLDVLTAKTFLM